MARRYSVSANRSPATKAPSAIDRPLAAATSAVPTTTSRQAAMNSSGLRVWATSWNSGRSATRPTTTIATRATTACRSANARPFSSPAPPAALSSAAIVNSTGAMARSWNSRIEKLSRPVGECSRFCPARIGMTIAVEESASAMPAIAAGPAASPSTYPRPPIASADRMTWPAPSPNTSRRRVRRRSNESSSPMTNIRNTTPNSARWPTSA